jgi:hypothetical protein
MIRGRRVATLVLAGGLILGIAGCGYSIPPLSDDTPQGESVTSTGSTLDSAGIQQILDTGAARFDLSNGPLRKADVGVAADAVVPDVSASAPVDLTIIGSTGELSARTERIRFLTTAGVDSIPTIYYFLTAEDPEALFALLRDSVDDYGFDGGAVEEWIAARIADPSGTSSFALQPGRSLGFDVTYDLRYDGSSRAQVVIVSVTA